MVKESFCFDTFDSRHEVLQGERKNTKHKNPNYWNLSCPLEGYYEKMTQGSCKKVVYNERSLTEWKYLKNSSILNHLFGVIDLQGLNILGNLKVGNGMTHEADCTHYCMPGVPDIIATALITMIKNIL